MKNSSGIFDRFGVSAHEPVSPAAPKPSSKSAETPGMMGGGLYVAASFDWFTVACPAAYADQVYRQDDPPPSPARLYYRATPSILAALAVRLSAAREAAYTGDLPVSRLEAAERRYAALSEQVALAGMTLSDSDLSDLVANGKATLPRPVHPWIASHDHASAPGVNRALIEAVRAAEEWNDMIARTAQEKIEADLKRQAGNLDRAERLLMESSRTLFDSLESRRLV